MVGTVNNGGALVAPSFIWEGGSSGETSMT
jgi:hypothetical protein